MLDPAQRVVHPATVDAPALGDVVLAAAATTEDLRGLTDQSAGPQVPLAAAVVDRHHDQRPFARNTGNGDDARPIRGQVAANLQRQPAKIIGSGTVRGMMRDVPDTEHVARARSQRRRTRQ
jgi:hypothetical protein